MALGAPPHRLAGMFVAQGMLLALLGGAVGFAHSVGATRALGGLLFEVDAMDAVTHRSIALLIGIVAAAAAYVPARRASRIDALEAIKAQ